MQPNAAYSDAPFSISNTSIGVHSTPIAISKSAFHVSSLFTQSAIIGATSAIVVLLSIYLSAVRYLRYRHIEKLQEKYGRTPAEFSKIDYKDAQAILGSLFLLDSPWIFLKAKDFAFLRVCTFACMSAYMSN